MALKAAFSFVLLFTTVANTAAEEKCNGGSECITLENCSSLNQILLKGSNPELNKLLKSLHCGFDNFDPMICCPPEFRLPIIAVGTRDNFFTDSEDTDLLPDAQVCGIQAQEKMLADHPWTTLLRYEKTIGWGFFCGGVLISSKYVLTAASCVKGQDLPSKWSLSHVRLGEWNTSSFVDCYNDECSNLHVDVPIDKIIVHDNYDPNDENQYNDIALLRLAKDVPYTDYVKPICLPTARINSTFEDYIAEVAGWGEIQSHANSETKMVSDVLVIGASECSNILRRDVNDNQMCVSAKDTCVGDYGGALMGHASTDMIWLALGIASYRPMSCQSPEYPTVYTRVDAYLDWITQMVEP